MLENFKKMVLKNFSSNITWNWVEICGPEGLSPWSPSKYDVGICFQQMFLQVPISFLFAVFSAYYVEIRDNLAVNLSTSAKWSLRIRAFSSFIIAIVAVLKIILLQFFYTDTHVRPVDYLTAGVELITWFVHFAYVLSLRHQRNINGPIILRTLWMFTFILFSLKLRSTISSRSDAMSISLTVGLVILQVIYGATFLTFRSYRVGNAGDLASGSQYNSLVESHYHSFREDLDPGYLGVAMANVSCFSKIIFYWVRSLIQKGLEGKIQTHEDLHDLPPNLTSSNLADQLYTDIMFGQVTLLRELHKCFGIEFYSIGILKLFADLLNFGGPLLLNKLVLNVQQEVSTYWSFLYVFALFVTTVSSAFLTVHFAFLMALIGMKLRGTLVSLVYRKVLTVSYADIKQFTAGEIFNFMSIDTERIVNSCPSFHSFWSIPLQIAVCFYLLYQQLGISFLAGVAFAVALIPINKLIASKIASLSTKLMLEKDHRVSEMSEILRGAKVLKFHMWEEYFLQKVLHIREREMKHLKGRKYLDALCVYFWATTPILVTTLTLGTYVLLGNHLDAATAFTSLALLNMLIAPLNAFPWVLNGLMEAWVSLKRVQRLFDVPLRDWKNYYEATGHRESSQSIEFNNFSATWNENENEVLSEITVRIERGQLVGIIGDVGSGKSAILSSILGEIIKTDGTIFVEDWNRGFGLVSQTPWLQQGTIRQNILFGKGFENSRYTRVLEACGLMEDLKGFKNEDMAKVGEAGMTLSGGQRIRLALARAIYQDKDVYLLDDVLSALDPIVARHVYQKVISDGMLKEKTRILCTSHVQMLSNADLIIEIKNGRISACGTPAEILPQVDNIITAFDNSESSVQMMESQKESATDGVELDTLKKKDENGDGGEEEVESRRVGPVSREARKLYGSALGTIAHLIVVGLALMQGSRFASDYWLSIWVSSDTNQTRYDTENYLLCYAVIAIANSLFTLIRAFLFAYGGIQAAKEIHEKLLKRILKARSVFFDIQPAGRILNRVSSDTYTVDDSLPFILNILCAQITGIAGSVALILTLQPILLLIILPMYPFYAYFLKAYRECARELKRLTCISLSPLYNHFNETLNGVTTIRAFRCLMRFQQHNEDLLDTNQRVSLASFAVTAWLSLRLQLMGAYLVTGVALLSMVRHEFDSISPAHVGLTIACALTLTGLLSGFVTAFAETEREFVAVERVAEYVKHIEIETDEGKHPPFGWPSQGVIEFKYVYMKYRENLPPSLNGISFITRPAEKIGVVGRTGAGKSSLIVTLLRLVDPSGGYIYIDTVDITTISLTGLRSRIAVIPQDPYLFRGTFRSNLDPLDEYRDVDILRALDKCHVRELVDRLGGLRGLIDAGGKNLSTGQRQLLCIARAVLKNSKIICIDEATASVDQETDRLIQQTIHSSFKQSTLIVIAHRISTVMSCDRLLVLRDGEMIEFDTPEVLSADTTSYFYQLSHSE